MARIWDRDPAPVPMASSEIGQCDRCVMPGVVKLGKTIVARVVVGTDGPTVEYQDLVLVLCGFHHETHRIELARQKDWTVLAKIGGR